MANVSVVGNTVEMETSHFTTFAVVPANTVTLLRRIGRYTPMETAIDAAQAAYPDGATSVVLTDVGTSTAPSPDSVSAIGLAGAENAPILLTRSETISPGVLNTIHHMHAKIVYVVGGSSAISNQVVHQITAQKLTVVRAFEGKNRFDTADLVARYLVGHHLTQSRTAFIANGVTLVDALSAGPVAYHMDAPIFLVNANQTSLPSSYTSLLRKQKIDKVVLLGGTKVVSSGLQRALAKTFGARDIERFAGANRDQTAATIDRAFYPHAEGAVLADNGVGGISIVNALSAAALAGNNYLPVVLTNPHSLPVASADYLRSLSLRAAWVMGGPNAISAKVAATVEKDIVAP